MLDGCLGCSCSRLKAHGLKGLDFGLEAVPGTGLGLENALGPLTGWLGGGWAGASADAGVDADGL